METISAVRHRGAGKPSKALHPILRSILFSAFLSALTFVSAATAYCSEIRINDINSVLSKSEKATLVKLGEKQIKFHRTHSSFQIPIVLNIRLFESEKDYFAYFRKTSKKSETPSPSGYYSPKNNEIVVNKAKKRYFKTLLHETQHTIFKLTETRAPLWLNEGLSTFFEETYVDNGIIYIRADKQRTAKVKKYLDNNELTPLSKLINISNKEWNRQFEVKDLRGKYYAECWSLVFFMMVDKQSRQRHDLVYIMRDLRKNTKGTTLQAINHRYPGGIDALERDWHKFVKNSNFKQKIVYQSH